MTDRGEAYMAMVKAEHKIPTKLSFTLSRMASRVNAITDPRKPTLSIAINFPAFICKPTTSLSFKCYVPKIKNMAKNCALYFSCAFAVRTIILITKKCDPLVLISSI